MNNDTKPNKYRRKHEQDIVEVGKTSKEKQKENSPRDGEGLLLRIRKIEAA